MKTLKPILISAILVLTMLGTSYAKNQPAKKVQSLSFEQAMDSPDLVVAMKQQLDEDMLSSNHSTYTVYIKYENHLVRITGRYLQWVEFFKQQLTKADPKRLPKGIN